MKNINTLITLAAGSLLLVGCKSTSEHANSLPNNVESTTTVGTVQKEIRQGMTQADVASVLGSPNIVTGGGTDKESWIYDKISTQTAYSTSSGGVSALILGGKGGKYPLLGGASAGYEEQTGVTSTTQKTLTVIINFKEGIVDDFKYHSSTF